MVGDLIEVVVADLCDHVVEDIPDSQRLPQQVKQEGGEEVGDVVVERLSESHDEEEVGVV